MKIIKWLNLLFWGCIAFHGVVIANECDQFKKDRKTNSNEALDPYTRCVAKLEQKQFLHKAFNFNYQNDAQMQAFITKMLEAYYVQLRQCHPGVYKYSLGTFAMTTTIRGYQKNKCIIESYSLDASDLLNNNEAARSIEKCQYNRNKLSLFTDQAAEAMTDESKFNQQVFRAVAEVNNRYCKSEV